MRTDPSEPVTPCHRPGSGSHPALRTWRAPLGALGAVALLAVTGCAVEVQNLKPAQELAAQRDRPIGSVHLGWRVYAEKCAGCHGVAATGGGKAPDLLVRVRSLGPRGFAERVLARYDLATLRPLAAGAGPRQEAPRDGQVDAILQRQDRPLTMPAWQGEPRVNAHILDVYAYLSARAEGRQDAGRPLP